MRAIRMVAALIVLNFSVCTGYIPLRLVRSASGGLKHDAVRHGTVAGAGGLRAAKPPGLAPVDLDLDAHIPINTAYPGLRQIHASPDIYTVEGFLSSEECDAIVAEAVTGGTMEQSPVAYGGWSEDLRLAVRAVPLLVLPVVYFLSKGLGMSKAESFGAGAVLWAALVAVVTSVGTSLARVRQEELQQLRTSTSTTLPGTGEGDSALVRKSETLLRSSWRTFEAPTVIRYEEGQILAPHYDANIASSNEDAARGGQTLATVLVYLNDVARGGTTSFGKLGPLDVTPKKGACLLFFPATAKGEFDPRVEHEGGEALDEKWLARIWKHEYRVRPPFGLPEDYGDVALR